MKYIQHFSIILCVCIAFILGAFIVQAKTLDMNIDLSACDGDPTCTWEFGDGTTATGCETKDHSYDSPDTYQVTMIMECGQASQTSTRQVRAEPSYSWFERGDWSPTTGCGEVEQTQTVDCVNEYADQVVSDSKCDGSKPDKTRVTELDNDCWPQCKYNTSIFHKNYVSYREVNGGTFSFYWENEFIGGNDQDEYYTQDYHYYTTVIFEEEGKEYEICREPNNSGIITF